MEKPVWVTGFYVFFKKEHQTDDKLFGVMRKEQILGVTGILFIVAGYAVHAFLYLMA